VGKTLTILSKKGSQIPTFFTKLAKLFNKFSVFIGDVIKLLSRFKFISFLGGLSSGLKYLAYPFASILSMIDFIKGFMKKEGNIGQKIIGGLKQVIKGFIELPVTLLG
jgi:hypothetical protein